MKLAAISMLNVIGYKLFAKYGPKKPIIAKFVVD
jgi:hypothetical protein